MFLFESSQGLLLWIICTIVWSCICSEQKEPDYKGEKEGGKAAFIKYIYSQNFFFFKQFSESALEYKKERISFCGYFVFWVAISIVLHKREKSFL